MYDPSPASAAALPPPPRKPRSRDRKRRRRAVPYPLRLATVVIAGMMFAWAMFQVMVKLVHPYKMGREEGLKVAEIKERLSSQRRKNAELYREVVYLKSAEGAESAARRAHYYRPGEIVYLLAPPTPPDAAPDAAAASPAITP